MNNFQPRTDSKFKQEVLQLARESLEASVSNLGIPQPNFTHPRFKQQLGVFVTLKKNKQLRGCIGVIEAKQTLWHNLQKMAAAAALEDPRFDPVRPDELDQIKIEVSILTKPELIADPAELEVSKHGVIIELRGRKGVFLPQVAVEYGYDREELLNMLCAHKLGLKKTCWQNPQAKIYVFEAEVYQE